jgi:hypothetical protein
MFTSESPEPDTAVTRGGRYRKTAISSIPFHSFPNGHRTYRPGLTPSNMRISRTIYRYWMVVFVLASVSCAGLIPPQPTPPAPAQIATASPPSAALQRVSQSLLANGFEIVTSDATGGVLVLQRHFGVKQGRDYLTCWGDPNSISASSRETTLRVNVVAAPGTVTVRSSAKSEWPGTGRAPSEEECVSSTKVESEIATIVKAPGLEL